VVVHRTLRRFNARVAFGARVDTFGVYARFGTRTIGVGTTTGDYASYLRITRRPGRTFAYGLMVAAITFGFCTATATICRARSDADTVDADVLTGTIGITTASG